MAIAEHDRTWTPTRIARLMKAAGLTDIQLAVRVGVSQRTVQDWRENKRKVRKQACKKLERLERHLEQKAQEVQAGTT